MSFQIIYKVILIRLFVFNNYIIEYFQKRKFDQKTMEIF